MTEQQYHQCLCLKEVLTDALNNATYNSTQVGNELVVKNLRHIEKQLIKYDIAKKADALYKERYSEACC